MAHPRRDQMFPVLTDAELERVSRFGEVRRFARGARLFAAGESTPGMFVVLAGRVTISQRDGLGQRVPVVTHGRGQFSGEIAQLSGRHGLVDGDATDDVEALLITPQQLRALIIAEADLGERIVRALILRRVGLIEAGGSGPVLLGPSQSPTMLRLQSFLNRNAYPHQVMEPEHDATTAALRAQYGAQTRDVLALCPNGSVLLNPSESALARCLGMLDVSEHPELFDIVVVGAGPAGLATAVYAASEGLHVIVLDRRSYGGQAGASARIENYLGFPTGISGGALAGRAYVQAQKFGAELLIPTQAVGLEHPQDSTAPGASEPGTVVLADGRRLRARAVVVATGARYRRPDVPRLEEFEGRSVSYWASALEAKLCTGAEVVVVGGGNSAGQGAVYLSQHAARVHVLVRGPGLAATMSRYLIDRIEAAANIELHALTELAALEGDPEHGLEAVVWRDRASGLSERRPVQHVFLFIGAEPETDWLQTSKVALDAHGFVCTGAAAQREPRQSSPGPLETSVRGVFAVGDVRSASVKRVGGAIGEGAAVVAEIHRYLAQQLASAAAD